MSDGSVWAGFRIPVQVVWVGLGSILNGGIPGEPGPSWHLSLELTHPVSDGAGLCMSFPWDLQEQAAFFFFPEWVLLQNDPKTSCRSRCYM